MSPQKRKAKLERANVFGDKLLEIRVTSFYVIVYTTMLLINTPEIDLLASQSPLLMTWYDLPAIAWYPVGTCYFLFSKVSGTWYVIVSSMILVLRV